MQVEQTIYAILSEILEIQADSTTTMQSTDKWTSLAHIDIIMSIEEEFGIAFGQEDLPILTSATTLIEKVRELL